MAILKAKKGSSLSSLCPKLETFKVSKECSDLETISLVF